MTLPVRLPDAASLETVLAGLDPALADAALVPALARAFPGFEFSMARIDEDWRNTRSVMRPDGTLRSRASRFALSSRALNSRFKKPPGCVANGISYPLW